MSLIDEALKRARMEAAQRAAESEGLPYPAIPRHLRPRRGPRWLVPAIVALGVAGGVALGLWLASDGGPPRSATQPEPPAAGAGAVGEPASASPPAPPAEPGSPPMGSSDTASRRPAAAPAMADPAAAGAASPPTSAPVANPPAASPAVTSAAAASPTGNRPPAEIGPATTAAVPTDEPVPPPSSRPETRSSAPTTAPAGAADQPAGAMTDPDSGVLLVLPPRPSSPPTATADEPAAPGAVESHVQSYTPPGGNPIELGGIAWSETGPFALINGSVVGPGTRVEGYVLESIRPDHVVLTGDGRRIQLSLR